MCTHFLSNLVNFSSVTIGQINTHVKVVHTYSFSIWFVNVISKPHETVNLTYWKMLAITHT